MGEFTPQQPVPPPSAGWYPDPSGDGRQRWFDGTNWGPYAPTDTPPPPAAGADRRFTIHYGFALLAIFSLLGTGFFAIPWLSSDEPVVNNMGIAWLFWGGMWTIIWTAFAIQHTLRSRR